MTLGFWLETGLGITPMESLLQLGAAVSRSWGNITLPMELLCHMDSAGSSLGSRQQVSVCKNKTESVQWWKWEKCVFMETCWSLVGGGKLYCRLEACEETAVYVFVCMCNITKDTLDVLVVISIQSTVLRRWWSWLPVYQVLVISSLLCNRTVHSLCVHAESITW